MTEIKTTETRKDCPSCKKEMWYIKIGTKKEGASRFKWEAFYTTWSYPLCMQYRRHHQEDCMRAEKARLATEALGFTEFDYRLPVNNCLSCKFHEISDVGFYCCNPKTEDTEVGGFHSLEEMVNGDGSLELSVCKEFAKI